MKKEEQDNQDKKEHFMRQWGILPEDTCLYRAEDPEPNEDMMEAEFDV